MPNIDPSSAYDDIAPRYDKIYTDPIHDIENKAITDILRKCAIGNMVDIGCGTWYVVDMLKPWWYRYYGIDISSGMIDVLNRKYSEYPFVRAVVGDFNFIQGKPYESTASIVSTFGGMSYMDLPQSMQTIDRIKWDDTLVFLMFYGDDNNYPLHADHTMRDYSNYIRPRRADIIKECVERGYYMYSMDYRGNICRVLDPKCPDISVWYVAWLEKYYILTNFNISIPYEFLDFIRKNKRIFAKTYADKAPHEYVLCNKAIKKDCAKPFANYIREHGYDWYFCDKPCKYMLIGNYVYRTLWELSSLAVITRAILKNDIKVKYQL